MTAIKLALKTLDGYRAVFMLNEWRRNPSLKKNNLWYDAI